MAVTATYRSDTNPSTTLMLVFTEVGRNGTKVTVRVDWTAKMNTDSALGNGNPRTLYIYKSDGTLCGSQLIKDNSTIWDWGETHSGSFAVSVEVGSTAAGSVALYGMTNNDTPTMSCAWTNRAYCYDVVFPYSMAFDITYNGNSVTSVGFNGDAVNALSVNGTTIF